MSLLIAAVVYWVRILRQPIDPLWWLQIRPPPLRSSVVGMVQTA